MKARNTKMPHGVVVVEAVKDASTRTVLVEFNDNCVALAKWCAELEKRVNALEGK